MDPLHPELGEPSIHRAADLLHISGVPVVTAAKVLAREPDSPITRTLKLWGDDENPFSHLITARSKEARVWRETMGILVGNLAPDVSSRTVWRGWHFESGRKREILMRDLEETGRFRNERVGMSASTFAASPSGPSS